jgi:hypothetical protein
MNRLLCLSKKKPWLVNHGSVRVICAYKFRAFCLDWLD